MLKGTPFDHCQMPSRAMFLQAFLHFICVLSMRTRTHTREPCSALKIVTNLPCIRKEMRSADVLGFNNQVSIQM